MFSLSMAYVAHLFFTGRLAMTSTLELFISTTVFFDYFFVVESAGVAQVNPESNLDLEANPSVTA